jgi:hypothetical protein
MPGNAEMVEISSARFERRLMRIRSKSTSWTTQLAPLQSSSLMSWNQSMNLPRRILRCHPVRLLRSSEQRQGWTLDMALINALVGSMTRRLAFVIDRFEHTFIISFYQFTFVIHLTL